MDPITLEAFFDELEKLSSANSYVKGIANNVSNTLAAFKNPVKGVKDGWNASGKNAMNWTYSKGRHAGKYLPGGKTLTLVGGAATLPGTLKKEDPSGKGESRTKRVSKWVGEQAGGLIGGRYGMSGSLAGGVAGNLAGSAVGSVADRVKGVVGRKKPAPQSAPAVVKAPPEGT